MLTEEQLWEMLRNDVATDLWLLDVDPETRGYVTRIVPGDDPVELAKCMDPSTWPRFICKSEAVTLLVRAHGIEKTLGIVNSTIEKTITRSSPRSPAASLGAMAGRMFAKRMGV